MEYNFSNNISEAEKINIIAWIKLKQPKMHTHILIECGEYVLTVVLNECNNVVGYNIKKPTQINIPKY